MRLTIQERASLAMWLKRKWKYYRDNDWTIRAIAVFAGIATNLRELTPANLYGASVLLGRSVMGEMGGELSRRGKRGPGEIGK
jgi:hypothetical protein